MAIIFEDSEKVVNKSIPIPKNTKQVFNAMTTIYEPYLDNNVEGSKVLKSLGSYKKYNKRGSESNKNGDKIHQDSVSVNDAKVRLHRMEKLPKNSVTYQLYGGDLGANLYRKGIERSRGVGKVKEVEPPKPTAAKPNSPNVDTKKDTKPTNGKVHYMESISKKKLITEDMDYGDFLSEYDAGYVLDMFNRDRHGKQKWGPLINPDMYQKALSEFVKYGKFVKFPTKYVYQWMGIIMKNTAILGANSELAGHSMRFPYEEVQDFLMGIYGEENVEIYNYGQGIRIKLTPTQVVDMCNEQDIQINEGVDKYGQTYFPWMSDDDIERHVKRNEEELMIKRLGGLKKYIDAYNSQKGQYRQNEYGTEVENRLFIDQQTNNIYWEIDMWKYLETIGLYDWMEMPDGSDAWSDYGIRPLEEIFAEYDSELPPEKVIVLVNKALDVYHQRGDMASIFIQGGSASLSQISESKGKERKIYINEKKLYKILEDYRQLKIPFKSGLERGYDDKLNYEHFVDYLEYIGKYGTLQGSGLNRDKIETLIRNKTHSALKYLDEYDFNYGIVIDQMYVEYRQGLSIPEDVEIEPGESLSDAMERVYDDFDRRYYKDVVNLLNNDGYKMFPVVEIEVLEEELYSMGFPQGLIIDNRGLIYVEREITVPKMTDETFNQGERYEKHNADFGTYFEKLSNTYKGLGRYWSWDEGESEAYCAEPYGACAETLVIKAWVNPNDVNWEDSILKTATADEQELELIDNAIVEVFEVSTQHGKNLINKTMLVRI